MREEREVDKKRNDGERGRITAYDHTKLVKERGRETQERREGEKKEK